MALPPLEAGEPDEDCGLKVSLWDGEWFVESDHPMDKDHYLSFLAQVTDFGVELVKLWPQQVPEAHFPRRGEGTLCACCNRHGLFCVPMKKTSP